MDESILYPQTHVEASVPLPIPEGEPEREKLSKDPRMMLSISMSRRERLPDDLHQSMVMWSFHPEFQLICKLYFQWASLCENELNAKPFSLFDSLKGRLSWMMSFLGRWIWASWPRRTREGSVPNTCLP